MKKFLACAAAHLIVGAVAAGAIAALVYVPFLWQSMLFALACLGVVAALGWALCTVLTCWGK